MRVAAVMAGRLGADHDDYDEQFGPTNVTLQADHSGNGSGSG